MRYVLTYQSPAELDMNLVMAHFEAHRARWRTFADAGTLLAALSLSLPI